MPEMQQTEQGVGGMFGCPQVDAASWELESAIGQVDGHAEIHFVEVGGGGFDNAGGVRQFANGSPGFSEDGPVRHEFGHGNPLVATDHGMGSGEDPANGGDAFVFQTSEPTAETEFKQLGKLKWEDIKDFPVITDVGDGSDNLATYQPDPLDIDLSLSAAVDVGIPGTMPEYALLLL